MSVDSPSPKTDFKIETESNSSFPITYLPVTTSTELDAVTNLLSGGNTELKTDEQQGVQLVSGGQLEENKMPSVELVAVAPEMMTMVPTSDDGQQVSSGKEEKGQQYLIVTADGSSALGLGTVQPDEGLQNEPAMKRFRFQGEDGQSYILTVAEPQLASGPEAAQTSEHQYQCKEKSLLTETAVKSIEKRNQLLGSDVSQAWFTTRDDKNILQNSGASWKQGQWTKDEIDLLQINISDYCRQHNVSDPTEIIFEMSKDERKEFYRTIARGLQRPLFSVYRRVTRMYDQKNHMGKYSPEEIMKLRDLRNKHGNDWATIGQALGRSASSVKDKCRLMKDMCNSGKWLPEEEKRLTQSVYELVGCKPGEDVVHGLSWAQVAEKVMTRSEKQCRTKWLNYMNWKLKGGKEWTREDDMNLIIRVADLGVLDDTEIDWVDLSKNWESVRSPQWLRGKWWSLKRHIPDYQLLPYNELLDNMKTFYLHSVRVRSTLNSARTRKLDTGTDAMTYVPISLSGSLSGEGSELDELDPGVQTYEVLQQLPNSSSYIIAQPPGSQSLNNPLSDHIIVQTVPISQTGDSEMGLHSHVVISVPTTADLGDNPLETSDLASTIQLPGTIDQTQQGLESLTEESVISQSGSLSDDTTFQAHTLEESVIPGPEHVVKRQSFIQSATSSGQLMTSFADPMLNSDSNSLIGSASDVETDKGHADDIIDHID